MIFGSIERLDIEASFEICSDEDIEQYTEFEYGELRIPRLK